MILVLKIVSVSTQREVFRVSVKMASLEMVSPHVWVKYNL